MNEFTKMQDNKTHSNRNPDNSSTSTFHLPCLKQSLLIFRQNFKYFSLIFEPLFHSFGRFHKFSHFIHRLDMSWISFLKHFHAMLFAHFSDFLKTVCMKLHVTRSAQLFTSHCLHI